MNKQNKHLRISILIPTFNRKDLVSQALDCILKNDHECIHEIIVSDNHSSDGSLEYLARRYAGVAKIILTKPPHPCRPLANWEHCLMQARGTHVHWHWSDDLVTGPLYRKISEVHQEHGYEMLTWPVHILFTDGFRPVFYSQMFDRSLDSSTALSYLLTTGRLAYSPAAYLLPIDSVRRHFYCDIPRLGQLDPCAIAMGPDALMIAGALLDGHRLGCLDQPMFDFRSHEGSITNQHAHLFRCYQIAFCYFIKRHRVEAIDSTQIESLYGPDITSLFFDQQRGHEMRMRSWFHGMKRCLKRAIGVTARML